MKTVTLQQDNHEKITISIDLDKLTEAIKIKFKWRKGDMIKRFSGLGSTDYDAFIKNLSENK